MSKWRWAHEVRNNTSGTLKTLSKGESVTLNETWKETFAEFPANVETARIIGGLLNQK